MRSRREASDFCPNNATDPHGSIPVSLQTTIAFAMMGGPETPVMTLAIYRLGLFSDSGKLSISG